MNGPVNVAHVFGDFCQKCQCTVGLEVGRYDESQRQLRGSAFRTKENNYQMHSSLTIGLAGPSRIAVHG